MNRRDLLRNALFGGLALATRPALALARRQDGDHRLAELEQRRGGKLGVAIIDTGSEKHWSHRGDQRFLLCSTFKLLAVAAVLERVDHGAETLARRVVFGPDVLLEYAPVTRQHVGGQGMTVAQLCQAAITLSDNTAANLLLASLGGPAAVTTFLRRHGDSVTRLDRIEPALNRGSPGDLRDTTTPEAMLGTMRRILLGPVLSQASREQLVAWLRATRTGLDRLRAGIPSDWSDGDKTGSGSHGEYNDVAIFWPPRRAPILVAAFYAGSADTAPSNSAVLADVGRIAATI